MNAKRSGLVLWAGCLFWGSLSVLMFLPVVLPSCALPGAPSGSPKGIPVAAAQAVLRGLADDVGNFDGDRDGLIRDAELSALGIQAAARLAAAATQQVAPAPPAGQ